ncbi:MAG TPA: 5'-3' exonuclease H3TH domain-containing protein, partial [Vicinamibacteria bacterium]
MPKPPKLYLVDGSAQFHRAFHAIRGLATSRGLPTNATYGFTTMLRKLLEDEKPERIGILFDPPGRTFRHEEYQEYKANRPRMDNDLAVQIPYVRRVCEAFRMPILEVPGWEADDVIATLARQAVERGLKVIVVSGDKDLLQLVTEDVLVLNPGREGTGATLYDRAKVEEKFGVPPERVVDILALVGDSVDNIPGVAGIGDKGARDLVREYGPVEAVLENADKVKRAAYREGLKTHRAEALLSKHLATLRTDVPITLELSALARQDPDRKAAHALFKELEFQALAREYAPEAAALSTERRVVTRPADLDGLVAQAREAGRVSLGVLITSPEPMRARVLGIALSHQPGMAVYVPVGHTRLELPDPPSLSDVLARLRPLLEDETVRKLSANAKRDLVALARHGITVADLGFDAIVASYLLNPGRRAYSLDDLAFEFLGERRGAEPEGISSE